MPFFAYRQNNSGGWFDFTDKLTHIVYIEASTSIRANRRAEQIGLYFDGHGDCRTCGRRWYRCDKSDGRTEKEMQEHIQELINSPWFSKWRKDDGPEIFVYRVGNDMPEGYYY